MTIDLLGCKLEDIIHASGKTGFVLKIFWQQLSKNTSSIRKY
jgi:hypothetical protein